MLCFLSMLKSSKEGKRIGYTVFFCFFFNGRPENLRNIWSEIERAAWDFYPLENLPPSHLALVIVEPELSISGVTSFAVPFESFALFITFTSARYCVRHLIFERLSDRSGVHRSMPTGLNAFIARQTFLRKRELNRRPRIGLFMYEFGLGFQLEELVSDHKLLDRNRRRIRWSEAFYIGWAIMAIEFDHDYRAKRK